MEKHFEFIKEIPFRYTKEVPLISGTGSSVFGGQEFLIIGDKENWYDDTKDILAFEIRYEYSCSPFREVMVVNNILAVGHEEYFYLYDLNTKNSIVIFKVDGYFSHLYLHENIFYIADASGIMAINKAGDILWENHSLAIDGVIINDFDEGKIYGSGEYDPPGGWRDFIIDLATGETII